MAGYARRPGVTPLSRARSLVIPDGERRGRRAGAGQEGGGESPGSRGREGRPQPAVQVGERWPPAPRRSRRSVQVRRPHIAPAAARGEVVLIVIPAPAFCERRSCLPQLDCGRSHGRDLDSHFFGIRPTFMCYVRSPVLASVGDAGERRASGARPALPVRG